VYVAESVVSLHVVSGAMTEQPTFVLVHVTVETFRVQDWTVNAKPAPETPEGVIGSCT
jgi:hypothetical protein